MLNRTALLWCCSSWLFFFSAPLFSAAASPAASAAPAARVPTAPLSAPKGVKPALPAFVEFTQRAPAEQGAILMAYARFLASVEADGKLPSVSAQSCGGSQEFECPALYAHRCVRLPKGSLQHLHRSCYEFCAGNTRCFEIAAAAMGLNEYARLEAFINPLCALEGPKKGGEAGRQACLRLIESLEVIGRREPSKPAPSPTAIASPSPAPSAAPSRWAGKCDYASVNGRKLQEIWVLSVPGAPEPLLLCQATLQCQEGKVNRSPVTALCMAEGESVQAARCPSDAGACAADVRIQSQGDFLEAGSAPKGLSARGSP